MLTLDSSGELSGAGFLSPTTEDKPEHLGINLLEQGTQESFSERREIPSDKSSGSECGYPLLAPSLLSLPRGLIDHTTSRLLGASCSQCAQAGCRQLLPHSTQGLREFMESAGRLT